jgi:hypothetical protein
MVDGEPVRTAHAGRFVVGNPSEDGRPASSIGVPEADPVSTKGVRWRMFGTR